jgi:hypothetical protein
MASNGTSINILSNVREGVRGVEEVADAVEDVADRLHDMSKDGGNSVDRLERNFRDLSKTADRTSDELKSKFRSAYQSVRQNADTAADDINRSTRKIGERSAEVGQEVRQNLGEGIANAARGDFASLADSIGDTFGGAVAGIGGIGTAAVAAAGALGVGLIIAAFQNSEMSAEELRAKVEELGTEFIETGGIGEASVDFIVQKLKEMAVAADGDSLRKLDDLAKRSGSSFEDLATAYGNNEEALRDLWREGDKRVKQLEAEADAADTTTNAGVKEYETKIKQADAQRDYLKYLGQSIGVAEEAARTEELYAEAGGPALERKAELIAAVNDAYDDAAGSVEDFIDSESGVLDVQGYIDAMNEKAKALQDYQTNLASSGLSDEAKSFLNDQGAEAAAQLLAGYTSGSDAQKSELNRIWTEAGSESSGSYVGGFGSPTLPIGGLDTSAADADFEALKSRLRSPINPLVVDVIYKDPRGAFNP